MIASAQYNDIPGAPASEGKQGGTEASLYDESYYGSQCGTEPYERSPAILQSFGHMADGLVSAFAPSSVLDVGCAHGFLVESLWDRGVRATGFDVSVFAISNVRRDMVSHCRVASMLEPIEGNYDLVTCIEVLEHIDAADAVLGIANICRVTDRVVFSSTPSDLHEPTHCNVQPPLAWIDHFADCGFTVDLSADVSFITPHAIAFKRCAEPQAKEIKALCSRLIRYRVLAHERGILYFAAQREAQQRTNESDAQLVQVDERTAAEAVRTAEFVAIINRLKDDNQELIATNRSLVDEATVRRKKLDSLIEETQDLRAANIAYEKLISVASVRLEGDVRASRDLGHQLNQNINHVVKSPLWRLKTEFGRLLKWR